MKKRICLYIISIALGSFTATYAQESSAKLKTAAELHKNYRFSEAAEIYRTFLAGRPDSTLTDESELNLNAEIQIQLLACENGKNLLKYGLSPKLALKKKFPARTFFLNYPGLAKNVWITPPEEYTHIPEDTLFNVMNTHKNAKAMVFSAKDESGAWNIMYSVKLNDSIWSVPQIVNENITTAGDEILPHLSPCGKKLYFASNGHSGMGGYDLYVSEWNNETSDWDTAQNLGFPFSSTGNDYLYYETPDGHHTIFSSDRETSKNEVTTYVTLTEVMPLKHEIYQKEAPLRATFSLSSKNASPADQIAHNSEDNANQHPEYVKYKNAVGKMKQQQEELEKALTMLQIARDEYSNTADSLKRIEMEKQISLQEMSTLMLGEAVNTSIAAVQEMELDMISKGIDTYIPEDEINTNENFEDEEELAGNFVFADATIKGTPVFNFEKIEPAKDYTLKMEKEAHIADLSELPSGLVYHIQLMTAPKKAHLRALKGFSPVFERKVQSGYTYSVGVFRTHAEAIKHLNTVRKRGFPTALITAYNNGSSVPMRKARELEKQDNSIYRVTISGYETLPGEAISIIKANTNRDIAKANVNGIMKYVIGPFTNKSQAEALSLALMSQNVTGVEIEKIESK